MADGDLDWGSPPASQPGPAATDNSGELDWGKPKGTIALGEAPSPAPTPVYSGSIVPMSRYSDGSVGFDSNAGIAGTAKGLWGAATLPHDVATGQTDPNSQEAIRRSLNLAGMATMAAPNAAVSTAKGGLTPPTAQELKAAAGAGYDAIRNMGVDYSIPHVADRAAQIQQGLNDKGLTSRVAPDVHATLNDLQNAPDGAVSVPLPLLDNARREFGAMAGNFKDPVQQTAAKQAQGGIDSFISEPPLGSVLAGPADQAAKTLSDARANYAAGSRSDALNKRGDYAEYKANDSNAGQNLPNNLRKQASWFLDPTHPERSAGFAPNELAALEQVNRGSTATNAARTIGSASAAGHGGLAGLLAGGAGGLGLEHLGPAGAALGAVPFVVGRVAKTTETNLTQKAFDNADNLIRQRSPLYQKQIAATPAQTPPSFGANSVTRAPGAAVVSPTASTPAARPATAADSNVPAMTPEEARRYLQSQPEGATFARGGAVKKKSHEELVSRLMTASEQAKAATKRDTKSLLSVPDNSIAKALAVAQRAI